MRFLVDPRTGSAVAALVLLTTCGLPAGSSNGAGSGTQQAVVIAGRTHQGMLAYLAETARGITDLAKTETETRDRWEAIREVRRSELGEMLGLDPSRARTPLNVQVRGTIERPGYRIERIAFESLPKVYVTANLYLPTGQDGPVPGVIYVCGHAFSPHGAKTSYQRHGHTLARHGYAAMVIDPIQIAETVGLHHGVYNQELYDWYTRAYSPAGIEVWNVLRALDYLETRTEIDSERFGITGRSGGAAMSWFSAAMDPRIKVAVPIMGIGTYAVSVADDTQRMHCDCMFPVNYLLHDLLHLGALIAPRPLLTAHGEGDPLFPVRGYVEFEEALSMLYASHGMEERFVNLVVDGGHQDSDFLRAEAVRWLDRWLLGMEPRTIDTTFEEVDPAELAVFGGQPPADARNHLVHEFFVPSAGTTRWSSKTAWTERQAGVLAALRNAVLREPADGPGPPETRPGPLEAIEGYESLEFDFAGHVPVQVLLQAPPEAQGPALVHVAAPGEDPADVLRLLRNLPRFGKNPLMVVFPPGTGAAVWAKSEWKMLLRNAMLTGRTVDSIRIGAVLRAIRLMQARTGRSAVTVSGVGQAAGWALYAAALDESVEHSILVRPPVSHAEGPIILGASRHADLPGIAALIAPRRLTFYGGMPAMAFV